MQKLDTMKNCLIITHKKYLYILWKTLNPIVNPKRCKPFSSINKCIIGQKVAVDKQETSNSMNEHFCNIGNELQSEIPDYGYKYMDYMPQRIANFFYLEPIAADDILIEMKKNLMHNDKSPGHDLIWSKVIQLCPGILSPICLKYTTGVLRTANVIQKELPQTTF